MAIINKEESFQSEISRKGRRPKGLRPAKADLIRLYVRGEKSIREVAEVLSCSKDMVARALKRYGINARTNAKRSKLKKHGLEILKAAAKKKGVRGSAQDLGVAPSTLSRFLRSEGKK